MMLHNPTAVDVPNYPVEHEGKKGLWDGIPAGGYADFPDEVARVYLETFGFLTRVDERGQVITDEENVLYQDENGYVIVAGIKYLVVINKKLRVTPTQAIREEIEKEHAAQPEPVAEPVIEQVTETAPAEPAVEGPKKKLNVHIATSVPVNENPKTPDADTYIPDGKDADGVEWYGGGVEPDRP